MNTDMYERPQIYPISTSVPNKGGNMPILSMYDIEGISVNSLVSKYGSPLFVISERKIRENIRREKKCFAAIYPDMQLAWSYKTNYLDAVCRIFHSEGSWAEVVSRFEYEKAIRNGIPGNRIIFNGPNKREEDIEIAIKNQSYIHIDSFDELFLVEKTAKRSKTKVHVAIRVNMKTGNTTEWDRFGFNLENGDAFNAASLVHKSPHMQLDGLHCHIGTYIVETRQYSAATKKMVGLSVKIKKELQHTVKYIDMGGGFASHTPLKNSCYNISIPSFNDYAEAVANELLCPELIENPPRLILETGRALIDDTTTLLTTILSTKRSSKGRKITVIDAGVNILFTSFWYSHPIAATKVYNAPGEETCIYGPLCMNIDVIRESVYLPPVTRGDILAIRNTGAYNITQSMQFINLRPAVVLIMANGDICVIRDKEETEVATQKEHSI